MLPASHTPRARPCQPPSAGGAEFGRTAVRMPISRCAFSAFCFLRCLGGTYRTRPPPPGVCLFALVVALLVGVGAARGQGGATAARAGRPPGVSPRGPGVGGSSLPIPSSESAAPVMPSPCSYPICATPHGKPVSHPSGWVRAGRAGLPTGSRHASSARSRARLGVASLALEGLAAASAGRVTPADNHPHGFIDRLRLPLLRHAGKIVNGSRKPIQIRCLGRHIW
jgi:hypothetical protein